MILLVLLLLSVGVAGASAQEPIPLPGGQQSSEEESSFEWDWGGYFEDTLNAEYVEEEGGAAALNAARLRLNLWGEYQSIFDFGASVVGILFAGRTEIDTVQYFPDFDQGRIVPPDPESGLPGARELFTYEIDNQLFFQEAFGTLYLPGFRVRAGRLPVALRDLRQKVRHRLPVHQLPERAG
jgi:hypothetical protein